MPIADIFGASHTFDLWPADLGSADLLTPTAARERSPEGAPSSAPKGSTPKDAETLVFIHGWLLSRSYWQPMVDSLRSHYRCLTYDMRGFGESTAPAAPVDQAEHLAERPAIRLPVDQSWYPSEETGRKEAIYQPSAYSLAAYAQDLGALLDALGLDQVWLVGHSLGGSVALWAAYLLPERIKGVICLNAGGGIYIPKEFEKFRSAGQQMVKFRPGWLMRVPLLPTIFTRAMVHKTLDMRWGKQRIQDFVRADSAAAEGALLESTTSVEVHQLPKLVGALSQPVHFITATQDSVMLPRYVNYLASFHPAFDQASDPAGAPSGAQASKGEDGREPGPMVSEIPDCGHMAMVEQPEAVVQIIKRVVVQMASQRGISADATGTVLQSP